MTAVLVTPSPVCQHSEHDECDWCLAEMILPSLQVLQYSFLVFRSALAGRVS